jgi:uncharacterized protein with NAD-binding domain and iron-sulfur cluster
MTDPIRVAIIGGGCAGLTTAFELTRPEQQGRYAVTVYQPGWRLGGKGASSRGVHDRIEEHGIHLWMGCYENAFRMIRRVYAETATLRPGCPVRHWREAFTPTTHIGLGRAPVGAWSSERGWDVFSAFFPPMPGLPGDELSPGTAENPFTVQGYVVRAILTLALLVEHAFASPSRDPAVASLSEAEQRSWTQTELLGRARRVLEGGVDALRSPAQLLEGLRLLLALVTHVAPVPAEITVAVLDLAAAGIQRLRPASTPTQRDATDVADVVELVTTSVRGCILDGAIGAHDGFERLDAWDFREWLRHHGASRRCVESPFVRGMYSLMFAYEHGDTSRPRLAAGVFLRVCTRMFFTYRGALFWRMSAGMGEIVFAPLYQCLRARGVDFQFFHRLERVHLDPAQHGNDVSRVAALELAVQETIRGGQAYEPLVDVRGLPCWPAEPVWDQIEGGRPATGEVPEYEAVWCPERRATKRLRVGHDFDLVVIAMSVAALPYACADLIDRHPRWRTMVSTVQTVATQAAQLWLTPTLSQLGWRRGTIMMTGFAPPFDSWGDMSSLIPWESWPADQIPGSLAYFCNVLPDEASADHWGTAAYAASMRRRVHDNVERLLDDELPQLWPAACDAAGHLDRRWLAGGEAAGLERQYLRANTNPSDRYVLSVPGSGATRISPLDRDCDNLTVAGDWTACGVDVGCIEAAVMSGMLAAHALTGALPRTDDIVGYHHP